MDTLQRDLELLLRCGRPIADILGKLADAIDKVGHRNNVKLGSPQYRAADDIRELADKVGDQVNMLA